MKFLDHSTVELIDTNATDDMVAMAAWVSFNADHEERLKDRQGIDKLINFLWKNKHTSPFEHGQFIFKVKTPLFVRSEFHRHRSASYNEISGRYTELLPEFYVPSPDRPLVQQGKAGNYTFVDGTPDQYAKLVVKQESFAKLGWDHYQELLADGIAKEVARMHMPMNLFTQFYATMNPRNFMHFLGLRTSEQALYEIREVAVQMEHYLKGAMPLTYEAYKNASD